ncbi:5929_t:CDS:2 [Diversispora eburnea]|uniref:5929_t:CDS:1 n=1 Tax=Diversispora eburnea TaxID=1213867 RepID=A0A9N8W9Q0_9GLOM|nr:5929_t:CDS:2 [Diversispora eburnea]
MAFNTKFTELFKCIGIKYPIVSAPMAFVTGVELATQVTLGGGFGFIPAGIKTAEELSHDLKSAMNLFNSSPELLPIGVGFMTFILDKDGVSTLKAALSHKPAAVWFSFGDFQKYLPIVREMSPKTKIFSQIQTVEMAIVSAKFGVDVIVAQGNESGGHGLINNASTLTLVPETVDALNDSGNGHIPVLAAGGIMDGRGLASALMLGASGVVMGTRFVASKESLSKPQAKEMLVKSFDGGVSTIRTNVFDKLRQPNVWPEHFDGRALRNKTLEDNIDFNDEKKTVEKRKIYGEAMKNADYSRAVIYAGAGVGLIKEILSAKRVQKLQ